jgi:hypothetical protein
MDLGREASEKQRPTERPGGRGWRGWRGAPAGADGWEECCLVALWGRGWRRTGVSIAGRGLPSLAGPPAWKSCLSRGPAGLEPESGGPRGWRAAARRWPLGPSRELEAQTLPVSGLPGAASEPRLGPATTDQLAQPPARVACKPGPDHSRGVSELVQVCGGPGCVAGGGRWLKQSGKMAFRVRREHWRPT